MTGAIRRTSRESRPAPRSRDPRRRPISRTRAQRAARKFRAGPRPAGTASRNQNGPPASSVPRVAWPSCAHLIRTAAPSRARHRPGATRGSALAVRTEGSIWGILHRAGDRATRVPIGGSGARTRPRSHSATKLAGFGRPLIAASGPDSYGRQHAAPGFARLETPAGPRALPDVTAPNARPLTEKLIERRIHQALSSSASRTRKPARLANAARR